VIAGSGPISDEPRLAFGVQEVADALGVSRELVKQMIRTGKVPPSSYATADLSAVRHWSGSWPVAMPDEVPQPQTVGLASRMTQHNPLGSRLEHT
jgi:hypothetical protein